MNCILLLVVWGTYVASCAPTVSVGDSGELIAASVGLGVGHPPGYPLYAVMTHIMTVCVPLGSLAFRAALGSALAGALACVMVSQTVIRGWGGSPWAGVAAGLLLAANRIFGTVCVQAEVYALSAWWWTMLAYAWIQWHKTEQEKWRIATWLLTGLAVAHHQLTLLIVPWLLFEEWVFRRPFDFAHGRSSGRGPSTTLRAGLMAGLLFAMMGLVQFVYLPLRGLSFPSVCWGTMVSASDVLRHVLREQYGAVAAAPRTAHHLFALMSEYGRLLLDQWVLPWGALAVATGLGWRRRRSGWWVGRLWRSPRFAGEAGASLLAGGLALTVTAGVVVMLSHPLTAEWRSIIEVFYLPSYLLVALGVGYVIANCSLRLRSGQELQIANFHPRLINAIGILAVGLAGAELVWGHAHRERWNNRAAYAFGRNLQAGLPERGAFLVSGDNQLFTLLYLQQVEGWRTDISLFEDSEKLSPHLSDSDAQRLMAGGAGGVAMWSSWEHRLFESRPGPFPHGLCYSAVPLSWQEGMALWKRYDLIGRHEEIDEFSHRLVDLQYGYLQGAWLALQGEAESARRVWRLAEERGVDNERFHYNLGIFYAKMGWLTDAKHAYAKAIEIHPEYVLPYANLGVLLMNEGSTTEAVEMFRQTVQLAPNRPDGYVNLGAGLARLGRMEEALGVWQEGLRVAPGHPLLRANVERVLKGE